MYLQRLRDLLVTQSAEITHLDDLAHARIEGGEIFQRFIQREQFRRPRLGYQSCLVQRHFLCSATTFERMALARVIDHDAPHELRGDGEKMWPVLPARMCLIYKL